MGSLSTLSVADGDIEITYDTQNTAEAIRAKRMIKDMLKRGYALLVEDEDGKYVRALDFNETKGRYIVADFAPETVEPEPSTEPMEKKLDEQTKKTVRSKARTKEIPMERANAVAVARTAGG